MAFLLLTGVLVYIKSKDMRVFWFALTLCAAKGISFNKTVKFTLITMSSCCFVFIVMHFLGVLPQKSYVINSVTRYSFGLGHPNMCSAYFAMIFTMIIYLYFDKLKIYHLLSMTAISVVVYCFSKSRTGLLLSLTVVIIAAALMYIPGKKHCAYVIIAAVLLGVLAFTVLPMVYNNSMAKLNSFLSGRIEQANIYFKEYGAKLFGGHLVELEYDNPNNILDIGYQRMLINNGAVYFILVVGGYIVSLYNAVKLKKYNLILLISSMLIYMYTENVATYIFMNVSMLIFADFIFADKKLPSHYIIKKNLNALHSKIISIKETAKR
jgi:hypothetical protein